MILGARQPKHGPDCLGFSEASRQVDGGAIGQRHNGANAGGRHQAPAHLINPDDGQQAAMQDDDLFAKRLPDNEQRFDQHRQIWHVLDKLLDPRLEFHLPDHTDLEAEVTQGAAQVVLDSDGLRLKQLSMKQQHPQPLTA